MNSDTSGARGQRMTGAQAVVRSLEILGVTDVFGLPGGFTKLAVLSNGTRADRPQVHDALMMVDDNILKLDTVDPTFIQLLDQPVGPYDVEHQIETFASFDGHVIIQTIFLTGEYQGKLIDNTGEEYVAPWLAALERIRPQEATIYTVARETPVAGLAKAAPEVLDTIAARVRALGIPCQVSY